MQAPNNVCLTSDDLYNNSLWLIQMVINVVTLTCRTVIRQLHSIRHKKSRLTACFSLTDKERTMVCHRACKKRRIYGTFCCFVAAQRPCSSPAGFQVSGSGRTIQRLSSTREAWLCRFSNSCCCYNAKASFILSMFLAFTFL